jgi:glycosyltransferase involved in cell wall biosynthesis
VAFRVAVIIPALNEAESLPLVFRDLPSTVQCVVVDNGSTDNTGEVAMTLGATVVREEQRGYGSAVLAGIRYLHNAPPDVVVILDADNADRADLIHFLVGPIRAGHYDFVLSDRTMHAEEGSLSFSQKHGNRLACALIRWATGAAYKDMGPFRAISWIALSQLEMSDPTWGWNVEMQMKAAHHKLRWKEVPMPYRNRAAGKSKISGDLKGVVKTGSRILWAVNHYRKP